MLFFSTPMDYDASFEVEAESIEQIVGDVRARAEEFDPDAEAALWIGPDGHGKNGAPYRIRDILDEMEEYGRRLKTLASELEKLLLA